MAAGRGSSRTPANTIPGTITEHPRFSPDGRYLAFIREGTMSRRPQSTSSRRPRPQTGGAASPPSPRPARWSEVLPGPPDGQQPRLLVGRALRYLAALQNRLAIDNRGARSRTAVAALWRAGGIGEHIQGRTTRLFRAVQGREHLEDPARGSNRSSSSDTGRSFDI